MQFETFDKTVAAFGGPRHITIQKRGTITINAASFVELGRPEAVELLYDPDESVLGLRKVAPEVGHAAFVRPSSRAPTGPWVISAMAFLRHYGIDTSVARRWTASFEAEVLFARLSEPGVAVSRTPRPAADQRQHRPRPRPTS